MKNRLTTALLTAAAPCLPAAHRPQKDQCKNGGWALFNVPRTFRNQGDCIQFFNTGK